MPMLIYGVKTMEKPTGEVKMEQKSLFESKGSDEVAVLSKKNFRAKIPMVLELDARKLSQEAIGRVLHLKREEVEWVLIKLSQKKKGA
jgi:hypothetical protein